MKQIETLPNGLIHTYSNSGKKLIQNETGILYDDAIDIPGKYTYIESDVDIDTIPEPLDLLEPQENLTNN